MVGPTYRGHIDEAEFCDEEIYEPQADGVSLRRARRSCSRYSDLYLHEAIHITAELVCGNLATVKRVEPADELAEDQGHER